MLRDRGDDDDDYTYEMDDYLGEYASVSSIVREALPFELIAVVGGIVSGIVLSGMTAEIEMIPGLLVLVPGIMGLRGNISSALGSRLSSSVHMGLVTGYDWRNRELLNNLLGSTILTIIISFFLGILSYLVSTFLGFPTAGLFKLILISVLSGVISGLLLSVVTVVLAIETFRAGLDPDNVDTPAIATIGDILSMIMIFIIARVVIMI